MRTICSTLKIRGVKNAKKETMVDKLNETYHNRKKYEDLVNGFHDKNNKPKKEIQCSFRLMNILFSDGFAGSFATLGNTANRAILDAGKASNDEYFWTGVKGAFDKPNILYDTLLFMDDDVLCDRDDIDPSHIVHHDWKKLRSIWKGVNADYKAALTRFTISGTHSCDFFGFCNGKLETYYLRKHLEMKPGLTGTVEADLTLDVFRDSDYTTEELSQKRISTPSSSSSTRKRNNNDMAEAIWEFTYSKMQSEISKVKLTFMERTEKRMEKEEARKEKEEMRKEKEYEWKEKEDDQKEKEEKRKNRAHRLAEWELIINNIRQLQKDLKEETDEEMKSDIRADLAIMMKEKQKLSDELAS